MSLLAVSVFLSESILTSIDGHFELFFGFLKNNYTYLETRRLSENVHLLRCTHPSSLRRTAHVRLIPQEFVRLASEHFSTASIPVGVPTGS